MEGETIRAILLLLLWGFAFPLQAIEIQSQNVFRFEGPKNNPSENKTIFRLDGISYFSQFQNRPDLNQESDIYIKSIGTKEFHYADLHWELGANTFARRTQTQPLLNELNISRGFNSKNIWTFGRAKKSWSELDSRWQLGLWQPHRTLDALKIEDEGLTGFFVGNKTENVDGLIYLSLFHVPNVGADMQTEKSQLITETRWFTPPPKEIKFGNQNNEVHYEIQNPEINKIFFQPALAADLDLHNDNLFLKTSAGWKPVNELILQRQNYKKIDQAVVDVKIRPSVTHHFIYSVDAGLQAEKSRFVLSGLWDHPVQRNPEPEFVTQKLEPLSIAALSFSSEIPSLWIQPILYQLEYFKAWGGKIQDITANGEKDDLTLIDERLKFKDAARFSLESLLYRRGPKSLRGRYGYLYDFGQKGSLLSSEISYFPKRDLAFLTGVEFIGVDDESNPGKGFFYQFRGNDRIYAGVSYVF